RPPARRPEDGGVERLRHERLPEVEVEDVGLGQVLHEGAPLHHLLTEEALPRQVEVDVVLLGPPLLRPEDEQASIDAFTPQRVHVRPAGAGEVDGEMEDAHGRNDTTRGLKRTLYRAARNLRHPRRLVAARKIRAGVAELLGGRSVLSRYEREVRESGLVEHLLDKGREHQAAVGGTGHSLGAIGYTEGAYLYAIMRHVRPQVAVETGVANGFSTAFTLLALQANGEGHLHSIDLPREVGLDYEAGTFYEGEGGAGTPPGADPGWLIPPELKERWTLILGRTQEELPPLVERLGQ